MKLYTQIARSHFGSSALFGGAFFISTLASEDVAEAAIIGLLAAGAWFTSLPAMKGLIGALPRA